MPVAGVDGAKGGWVAVLVGDAGPHVRVAADFRTLLARLEEAELVCVDMPIGLPERGLRPADIEARQLLGPRWRSVFLTPPRAVLRARSHADAVAICKELTGHGVSQQAWGLGRKIKEVNALAERQPERIREGHPEVTFWALNGRRPLAHSKHTWNGLMQRRRLLEDARVELPDDLGDGGAVAPDDVLDAAALAWTANRVASGQAATVPDPPVRQNGRQVAIWY